MLRSLCLLFVCLHFVCPLLVHENLWRTHTLRDQYLRTNTRLHILNEGNEEEKTYTYILHPSEEGKLVFFEVTIDNEESTPLVHVVTNSTDIVIYFNEPLQPNAKLEIIVRLSFAKMFFPKPDHIKQQDPQNLLYSGTFFLYSKYKSIEQKTYVVIDDDEKFISYFKKHPTNVEENTLTYGPYGTIEPYTNESTNILFSSSTILLTVTHLFREYQISHWGDNIALSDHVIDLVNAGATLDGSFSRVDFQANPENTSNVVLSYIARLPSNATDFYFRDETGNISTSYYERRERKYERERENDKEIEKEKERENVTVLTLILRYLLLGGWKTAFEYGCNLPLRDSLRWRVWSGNRESGSGSEKKIENVSDGNTDVKKTDMNVNDKEDTSTTDRKTDKERDKGDKSTSNTETTTSTGSKDGYTVTKERDKDNGSLYRLTVQFSPTVHDVYFEEVTLRFVLPEDAYNARFVSVPFDEYFRLKDERKKTYLDSTKGRLVIGLRVKNVAGYLNRIISIQYTMKSTSLMKQPMLLIGAIFTIFLFFIGIVRIDLKVGKDNEEITAEMIGRLVVEESEKINEIHNEMDLFAKENNNNNNNKSIDQIHSKFDSFHTERLNEVLKLSVQMKSYDNSMTQKCVDFHHKSEERYKQHCSLLSLLLKRGNDGTRLANAEKAYEKASAECEDIVEELECW